MQRTESINETVKSLRKNFNTKQTFSYEYRITQLKQLRLFLQEKKEDIFEVLTRDLSKPRTEALMLEYNVVKNDVDLAIGELKSWMQHDSLPTQFTIKPSRTYAHKEPLGVVLIISPWNYPFQLSILPLVGAIATGNAVVLKPSELAAHTSAFLAEQLTDYLDPRYFSAIQGGIPESQALLKQKFDHIFFTGSREVGKIVYQSAASTLTPVTLELGGKSPCIVMPDANLDKAAERILWGKCVNAGQTCIAPDYLLAHESIKDAFLLKLKNQIKKFYGDNVKESKDFARIINDKHFNRLVKLLESAKNIYCGGEHNAEERYIVPTILDNVSFDDEIMDQANEIFGPILPVISFNDLNAALREIDNRPKPLALYLFTSSKQTKENVKQFQSAGGMVVNHTLMQAGFSYIPFGGVGDSGFGSYHGKTTFDTFTHDKPIVEFPANSITPDLTTLVMSPYKEDDWVLELGIKMGML